VTDVTQERDRTGAELSAADEQVLLELTERARTGGLKLTGEGRLTKMVIEGAIEGELDHHLGYARHDPEGRDGGNSRNGHRARRRSPRPGPGSSVPAWPLMTSACCPSAPTQLPLDQPAVTCRL